MPSISLVFNSWSESNHNSIDSIFSDCCLWDLTSASEVPFPGVVGRAEHPHLPRCFKSVLLSLFYRCGWRVGLMILSVGIKCPSSLRWRRSTTWMRILTLPQRPHALWVDCSCLPSDLVVWSKLSFLNWTKYPLWWISPFLQSLLKNR
jgi:hypothetical protein